MANSVNTDQTGTGLSWFESITKCLIIKCYLFFVGPIAYLMFVHEDLNLNCLQN